MSVLIEQYHKLFSLFTDYLTVSNILKTKDGVDTYFIINPKCETAHNIIIISDRELFKGLSKSTNDIINIVVNEPPTLLTNKKYLIIADRFILAPSKEDNVKYIFTDTDGFADWENIFNGYNDGDNIYSCLQAFNNKELSALKNIFGVNDFK